MVLVASISANVICFWYLRKVLPGFIYMSDNLEDLTVLIKNYRQHLKDVYQMELYYGDETIKFLMSHTTSLVEMLEDYEDTNSIAMPIEELYEEEIIEGEQPDGETEINEENVFYAGSRRRDS